MSVFFFVLQFLNQVLRVRATRGLLSETIIDIPGVFAPRQFIILLFTFLDIPCVHDLCCT